MTTSTQDDRRVPTKAKVEHLTVAERVARGQAARADVPRSAHAEFDPGPERPDPVALLEGQATTRVPELVPIRYGRMLVSPFTFYRGAALIMAATWPPRRPPACASSSAATPTCRTSASSAPPSGAWSSTSTTSTRPCRGRSSGTSSAWRPASRWPAATGASPTPSARRCVRACVAQLPHGHGRLRRAEQPGDLLRAPRRRRRRSPATRPPCRASCSSAPRRSVAKARTKDSMQALDRADPRGGRRAAHQRRPPADRPDRRPAARRQGGRPSRTGSTPACASTGAPCPPTAGACSSATASSTSRARWWGWAAWARGPGSP